MISMRLDKPLMNDKNQKVNKIVMKSLRYCSDLHTSKNSSHLLKISLNISKIGIITVANELRKCATKISLGQVSNLGNISYGILKLVVENRNEKTLTGVIYISMIILKNVRTGNAPDNIYIARSHS